MGRHSSTPVREKPARENQLPGQRLHGLARRVWHLLPTEFRRRMWHRRQAWRTWWDRRYMPSGEWDQHLPKDPSMWTDEWQWGSVGVAATLRATFRRRGDLLPEHHKEQS